MTLHDFDCYNRFKSQNVYTQLFLPQSPQWHLQVLKGFLLK